MCGMLEVPSESHKDKEKGELIVRLIWVWTSLNSLEGSLSGPHHNEKRRCLPILPDWGNDTNERGHMKLYLSLLKLKL